MMEDFDSLLKEFEASRPTCPICGEPMSEASGPMTCYFCGRTEEADYVCPKGHYVCEECRLASAEEIVLRVFRWVRERDPSLVAERIMTHPAVEIFGPAHHIIVAASLLAASRNAGADIRESHVKRALRRLKIMPYGSCALIGACGAAVGAGTAVSLMTGATYLSDRERSLAMEVTSRALARIAELGGPRCCKASVYASLEAAVPLIREELGISLELRSLRGACRWFDENDQCWGSACPYHP